MNNIQTIIQQFIFFNTFFYFKMLQIFVTVELLLGKFGIIYGLKIKDLPSGVSR